MRASALSLVVLGISLCTFSMPLPIPQVTSVSAVTTVDLQSSEEHTFGARRDILQDKGLQRRGKLLHFLDPFRFLEKPKEKGDSKKAGGQGGQGAPGQAGGKQPAQPGGQPGGAKDAANPAKSAGGAGGASKVANPAKSQGPVGGGGPGSSGQAKQH